VFPTRLTFPVLLVLGLLSAARPGVVCAQSEPSAAVNPETGALEVDLGTVLEDRSLRGALHSGLPVRIEVRVELWKDGFFDQQEQGGVWRASVIHDVVTQTYEFAVGNRDPVALSSLEAVGRLLQSAFDLEVGPTNSGRYYYLAEVQMETLSLSDLEELRRWLQGDLGAVVRGDRPPETAVTRGLRRIMVRALGLPARRERLRTATFSWPMEEGR
jgi:hypothetical protein